MSTVNNKKAITFLAITFGICWALAGIFVLFGGKYLNQGIISSPGIIMASIYMLVPVLGAFITQKLYKEKIIGTMQVKFRWNKWFALSWLIFPLIMIITQLVGLLWPDVSFSTDMEGMFGKYGRIIPPDELQEMYELITDSPLIVFILIVVSGLLTGITINAVMALGEEIGWRGLLQNELKPLGFWKMSLFIGAIWGLWHAPLILMGHNYPQNPVTGMFLMIACCVLLGPLFAFSRIKSGTILAPAVMHGTLNGSIGLSYIYSSNIQDISSGLFGFPGIIVLVMVNIGLFIYLRKYPIADGA